MGKVCPRCSAPLMDTTRFCPFDGTRLDPEASAPKDPFIGKLVDERYRINSRLGEGGWAQVYLAHHATLQRDVALKVLHAQLAGSADAVARFAREARAASRIAHENVVCILDFGVAPEGFYYLVMEYVAGRVLSDVLASGPISAERTMHVLSQIAAALDHTHDIGIIHRDLKPANVMLCERGSDRDFVKMIDFGLSRVVKDEQSPKITHVGQVFGTPEYMSPEQWNAKDIDERTDIYALGMTGYQLLTGEAPFSGNLMSLMRQHLEVKPRAPGELVPHGQPQLDALLAKCLEKDPEKRFQSMSEVLEALGEAWKGLPPKQVNTTYAATQAAPPKPDADALPDVTMYETGNVDAAWDGPALCEELRRLHSQRLRRLGELTQALWGEAPPEEVRELTHAVDQRETVFDRAASRVLKLQAKMEEVNRAAKQEEGGLREQMIDANLEIIEERTGMTKTLARLEAESVGAATIVDQPPAATRLKQFERRIASLDRKRRREWLEQHAEVSEQISELAMLEDQLEPLIGDLSKRLRSEVRERPQLRPSLVNFQKIDGAIAAYQAVLAALEG